MKTVFRRLPGAAVPAVCLLILSGCAGMLMSTTPPAKTTTASTGMNVEDAKLAGAVRQRLQADDRVGQFAISVSARHGQVTLSGAVGSYVLRDRAVQLAKQTTGTISVDSRLVVNTNL